MEIERRHYEMNTRLSLLQNLVSKLIVFTKVNIILHGGKKKFMANEVFRMITKMSINIRCHTSKQEPFNIQKEKKNKNPDCEIKQC